jgi:hypothetical protein
MRHTFRWGFSLALRTAMGHRCARMVITGITLTPAHRTATTVLITSSVGSLSAPARGSAASTVVLETLSSAVLDAGPLSATSGVVKSLDVGRLFVTSGVAQHLDAGTPFAIFGAALPGVPPLSVGTVEGSKAVGIDN